MTGTTQERDQSASKPRASRWVRHAGVAVALLALIALSWAADVSYRHSTLASPLIAAIRADERSRVASLLDEGADPNARDFPLRQFNLLESLRLLLHRSKRPPKESYPTALMVACGQGHSRIAEMLLRRGADPNLRGPGGTTALHEAVVAGADTVDVLLAHHARTEATDSQGETPLLRAVRRTASGEVDYNVASAALLAGGASPRAADAHGYTPMSYAAEAGLTGLYEPLLAHGADPDSPRPSGGTALLAALEFGDRWGNAETVKLLLRYRASPNARYEGRTPFLGTLGRGDLRMFRLLLSAGGDPNTTDRRGRTMLCLSIARRLPDAVDLLLRGRADPNRKSEGRAPLLDAVQAREYRSVSLLLAHGADPNSTDPEGTTPLMIAAFNDDAAMVRALLSAGARAGTVDAEGLTAVLLAAASPSVAPLLRATAGSAPTAARRRANQTRRRT